MAIQILIIEEEERARTALEGYLVSEKFSVFTSENIQGAEQILREQKVDVLLSSLCLDDQFWFDSFGELSKHFPKVPSILMSHSPATQDLQDKTQCLGATQILYRPFARSELSSAIQSVQSVHHSKLKHLSQIEKDDIFELEDELLQLIEIVEEELVTEGNFIAEDETKEEPEEQEKSRERVEAPSLLEATLIEERGGDLTHMLWNDKEEFEAVEITIDPQTKDDPTELETIDTMDSICESEDLSPLKPPSFAKDNNTAQDNVAQDNVAQDNVAQDNVAQDNVAQDNFFDKEWTLREKIQKLKKEQSLLSLPDTIPFKRNLTPSDIKNFMMKHQITMPESKASTKGSVDKNPENSLITISRKAFTTQELQSLMVEDNLSSSTKKTDEINKKEIITTSQNLISFRDEKNIIDSSSRRTLLQWIRALMVDFPSLAFVGIMNLKSHEMIVQVDSGDYHLNENTNIINDTMECWSNVLKPKHTLSAIHKIPKTGDENQRFSNELIAFSEDQTFLMMHSNRTENVILCILTSPSILQRLRHIVLTHLESF